MTPLFPAQRAAEEFDQVVSGTADQALTERYVELAGAVAALRAVPEVSPRPGFVGDLRAQLMTAAATELVPSPAVVRSLPEARTRRRNRRLSTLAASLVVIGGTAGMAAASSGALPGDALYPVKRGVEQATTAVQLGDAAHGRALLDQATTRLEELRALQARGSADPDLAAETVAAFRDSADRGATELFGAYEADGDQADIATVRSFAASRMAEITDLTAIADTATNDLLLDAVDTLADIDLEARTLCGGCGPAAALATPELLGASAAAVTMSNLIARPVAQAQNDIGAAQRARIKALQGKAEKTAGRTPLLVDAPDGTPTYAFPGTSGKPGDPVVSVVSPEGELLPAVTSGAVVKDVTSGVTGAVDTVTGGVTKPLTDPVNGLVGELVSTLDETTEQLLPQLPTAPKVPQLPKLP